MNIAEKTLYQLEIAFEIFIDILFPKKTAVRRLEMMNSSDILAKAAKASSIGNSNFGALFSYHDAFAKKIVWEIKYRGNTKLANIIGKLLCEKILHKIAEGCFFGDQLFGPHEKILVIPIPISARRLKHRGFSQTELIAKAMLEHIPEDLRESFLYRPDILEKIKETPPQASLGSRASRLSNLFGAFALKNAEIAATIHGKNIILIDDVITTGATMKEVAGTLLDAGAKSITGFAIAH